MKAHRDASRHDDALGRTRRAIVDALKRRASTAPELASEMGITREAVRQHLRSLGGAGLVVGRPRASRGRGRPPTEWVLTDLAGELFPDRHGELAVALIESIRHTFGNEGLECIVEDRNRRLTETYVVILGASEHPVRALADQRSAEGFVAEVRDEPDGSQLLMEHHCPICDAASTCQGLCRGELELFRNVLGPSLEVTREEHLLSGDDRCTYRIRPRPSRAPVEAQPQ